MNDPFASCLEQQPIINIIDPFVQQVKEVIAHELGLGVDNVSETDSFTDDLGADSLDVVELVMAFEEEFGIDIPDDDVLNLKTVDQAIKYLRRRVN